LNIPLHIAEQGKDRIAEFISLYNKKESLYEELSKLSDEFEEARMMIFNEITEPDSYYRHNVKPKHYKTFADAFNKDNSPSKVTEDLSRFTDTIWTANQKIQRLVMEIIVKNREHSEVKEKYKMMLKG
jgi:hypothetical protein